MLFCLNLTSELDLPPQKLSGLIISNLSLSRRINKHKSSMVTKIYGMFQAHYYPQHPSPVVRGVVTAGAL